MKGALLMTNVKDESVYVNLELIGINTDDVQILLVDRFHRYTLTGMDLSSKRILLPPHSFMEIKLLDPAKQF